MHAYPEVRPSTVKNTFLVSAPGHVPFISQLLHSLSPSQNSTILIDDSIYLYIYRASIARGPFYVPQNSSHVHMPLPKAKSDLEGRCDGLATLTFCSFVPTKNSNPIVCPSQTRLIFDSNLRLIVPLFALFPSSLFFPSTTNSLSQNNL